MESNSETLPDRATESYSVFRELFVVLGGLEPGGKVWYYIAYGTKCQSGLLVGFDGAP